MNKAKKTGTSGACLSGGFLATAEGEGDFDMGSMEAMGSDNDNPASEELGLQDELEAQVERS
jgi:hypothetical protein